MCVFCQIAAGELPAHKIYEDEKFLAFLDIKPVNLGHTLVIPKQHYADLEAIPPAELAELIIVAQKIGRLLKERLGVTGYNLTENNGAVAGQIIPHLHFHVIPRHEGDGHVTWMQSQYGPGEAEEILKKLTA